MTSESIHPGKLLSLSGAYWETCALHGAVKAEKTIKKFDMSHRINFQEGNFLETQIEGTYDVVWISHILHGDSPEDCKRIVKKAARVLEPGA